jgi:hypothetical protein
MHLVRLRRFAAVAVATGALVVGVLPMIAGTAQAGASGNTVVVTPGSSINNESPILHITGSTFVPASDAVTLTNTNVPADVITGVIQGSSTASQLDVLVDLNAAAPTQYDVLVNHSNIATADDSCADCFTVSSATPAVSTITSPVARGTTRNLTLSGANFARGMILTFGTPTGLTVNSVDVTGPTAATANVTVGGSAAIGTHSVTVKNADNQSALCTCTLTVDAAPLISTVTPPGMAKGESHNVVITGTGFQSGADVTLTGFSAGVTATGEVVNGAGTQITVLVTVPAGEAVATGTIVVTNLDEGTANAIFNVTANPTITSVVPNNGPQGLAGYALTVNGTGFVIGAGGTTFTFANAGVTVTNTTVVNATTATLTVTIAADAVGGDNAITATNADFGNGTCTDCFSVKAAPTVTGATPNSKPVGGAASNITVTGTGFSNQTPLGVTQQPTTTIQDVTVNSTTYVNSTTLTVNITVPAGAPQGDKPITVTNPDQGAGSCPNCFTVTGITVSTVAPSAVVNDGSKDLDITGAGFGTNPTVTIRDDDASIVGAATQPDINGVVKVSPAPTNTTVSVTADMTGAAPGTYDVIVVANGGATGVCDKCLTVNGGIPTVTSVTPNRIAPGQQRSFTLLGTNFAHGMGVVVTAGDVTVGTATYVSRTSATVSLTAGSSATPTDTVNVRVQNTDTKISPTAAGNVLTIAAPPTLTVTLPVAVVQGASPASGSVALTNPPTGGSFNGRVDFVLSGLTGLTPAQVTFEYLNGSVWTAITLTADGDNLVGYLPPQSGTAMDASGSSTTNVRISLAQGAPHGTLNVASSYGDVVSNARTDTVATDSDNVIVQQKPGAPTNVQADPGNASATVSWDAPTNNGSDPITSYTVVPSPACGPCTGVTTANGTTLQATVSGLTNGVSYTFTVYATSAAGNGPASAPSAAVTPAGVPVAPTNASAVGSNASALVTWTAPSSDNGSAILSYTVIPSPGCDVACTNDTTADGTTTSTTIGGLTNGTPYTFTVIATNAAGNSLASEPSNEVTPLSGSTYHALAPVRVLDTRNVPRRTIAAGGTLHWDIAGSFGVPANATSLILNATTVNQTAAGYLTVFPRCNCAAPLASNVNFAAHSTTPALVSVQPGLNGNVSIKNGSSGTVDVVLDLFGYSMPFTNEATYHPTTPVRVLDTRTATGGHPAKVTANEDVTLDTGVPDGATAAVLNLTVTAPTSSGFFTAYAADQSLPLASNVNFVATQTAANLAVVPVDSTGHVKIRNGSSGMSHMVADVAGWYVPAPTESSFHGHAPIRLKDTRDPNKTGTPVPANGTTTIQVTGVNGVPSGATGVVITLTVTNQTQSGNLRVYPTPTGSGGPPLISNLNFVASQPRANLVFVQLPASGNITIYNASPGTAHVVVDQAGYFTFESSTI